MEPKAGFMPKVAVSRQIRWWPVSGVEHFLGLPNIGWDSLMQFSNSNSGIPSPKIPNMFGYILAEDIVYIQYTQRMHQTRRFPVMGLVPHKPEGAKPLASIGVLGEPTVHNSATHGEGVKQRLRWTSDLHERFVNAITQLGGPDRATPKGVLTMMDVPGLTIYHVKSHLQKYRLAKFLPDSSADVSKDEKEGSAGSISNMENLPSQLNETFRIQMEVQKRLQEQLEVQRQLQLRIEAQGKYLQKIIEEQQKLGGLLKGSESFESPPSNNSAPQILGSSSDSIKRRRVESSTDSPAKLASKQINSDFFTK